MILNFSVVSIVADNNHPDVEMAIHTQENIQFDQEFRQTRTQLNYLELCLTACFQSCQPFADSLAQENIQRRESRANARALLARYNFEVMDR